MDHARPAGVAGAPEGITLGVQLIRTVPLDAPARWVNRSLRTTALTAALSTGVR